MRILITGSRKGIGRYLAEKFLERGHVVFGCSRGECDLQHDLYHHSECDVSDERAVIKLVRAISKSHDGIDVLINNAGIASMNHILSTPGSTARCLMDTNFIGSTLFCREVAKLMVRKKIRGKMINFSTVASALSLEGEAIYAASKAAVQKFSQVAAKEFAPFGITVNCIGPTPVDTDLIKAVPKNKIDLLMDSQAIKRLGTKEDVLNVVDFFMAESSEFITAQTIYLGGVHD
jgi:3-oxoacyl-[acyl-carrier protein] reductase